MGILEKAIFPGEITQAGLEGLLAGAQGELVSIRIHYPLDERGIPRGYTLVFDTERKRPFYDVVLLPGPDPFGSNERSLMMAHRDDIFMGKVHSMWCGIHEVYLVFKKRLQT